MRLRARFLGPQPKPTNTYGRIRTYTVYIRMYTHKGNITTTSARVDEGDERAHSRLGTNTTFRFFFYEGRYFQIFFDMSVYNFRHMYEEFGRSNTIKLSEGIIFFLEKTTTKMRNRFIKKTGPSRSLLLYTYAHTTFQRYLNKAEQVNRTFVLP